MINIEKKHLKILNDILKKYPYHFYAFGSRVKGNNRKYSDLDICYKEEIPPNIITEIKEQLEESNLPFRTDLVLWDNLPNSYRELIKDELVPLNQQG